LGFEAGLLALDDVADDPRLARSGTVATIRADLLRRPGRLAEAVQWYRILANWAVNDYRARVVLAAGPEGGRPVTWSGEFTERLTGTGILWRRYLIRFLGGLAKRLIAHAQVAQRA
jgi:hypothetical protein